MGVCICCTPKSLPRDKLLTAADVATTINPVNHPPLHRLAALRPEFTPTREDIAILTTKWWHTNGVKLTVGFLDDPSPELRAKILQNMNAWSTQLNVSFVESSSDQQVRIARTPGDGYWSYLGTDILSIDRSEPTMNLESFTINTPDAEYRRVVRHETGHTLGCPHEHMRQDLVNKIDPEKAFAFFASTQGWSRTEVEQQVLTPIESSSLWGTDHSDPNSIMCYQIPGTITKDGQPIPGGTDIDDSDFAFMKKVYPKPGERPGPANGDLVGSVAEAGAQAGHTELAQLREDNAVLKKALAIFARQA